ncbi:hypothetical protein, partial [Amaricoccus sp.]|uniref:hypothetical protein n=1 Tax=Amaricoccus sp. TaxID=1872485 RepID=UPI002C24881B
TIAAEGTHAGVVAAFLAALAAEPNLFVGNWLPKRGALQVTIPLEKLASADAGAARIAALLESIGSGEPQINIGARILRSGHSIDVVPSWVSKVRVVEEVRRALSDEAAVVLRIGDSGDNQGNDFELLEGAFGLSVDRVCHRDGSCWNLLPPGISGPEGLARILRAIQPLRPGIARVDVPSLFTI